MQLYRRYFEFFCPDMQTLREIFRGKKSTAYFFVVNKWLSMLPLMAADLAHNLLIMSLACYNFMV